MQCKGLRACCCECDARRQLRSVSFTVVLLHSARVPAALHQRANPGIGTATAVKQQRKESAAQCVCRRDWTRRCLPAMSAPDEQVFQEPKRAIFTQVDVDQFARSPVGAWCTVAVAPRADAWIRGRPMGTLLAL